MIAAGAVFVGLAALIHVYIFVLESLIWTTPRARAVFGTSEAETASTRELAFNQGFYNLFLAIAVLGGLVALALGDRAVGATAVFVGAGSMVAAGVVLILSSPDKRRAALVQAAPPLIGIVLLAVGLIR